MGLTFYCVKCKKMYNENTYYRLGAIMGEYCVCCRCAAKDNYRAMVKERISASNSKDE